jgi:hypothetical protein
VAISLIPATILTIHSIRQEIPILTRILAMAAVVATLVVAVAILLVTMVRAAVMILMAGYLEGCRPAKDLSGRKKQVVLLGSEEDLVQYTFLVNAPIPG